MFNATQLSQRLGRYMSHFNLDGCMQKAMTKVVYRMRKKLLEPGVAGKPAVYTGELFNSLYPVRLGRGVWDVKMPTHGEYLDNMLPHTELVRANPQMRRWWKYKVLDGQPGFVPTSVTVHPRPFIDYGYSGFPEDIYESTQHESLKILNEFVKTIKIT